MRDSLVVVRRATLCISLVRGRCLLLRAIFQASALALLSIMLSMTFSS